MSNTIIVIYMAFSVGLGFGVGMGIEYRKNHEMAVAQSRRENEWRDAQQRGLVELSARVEALLSDRI